MIPEKKKSDNFDFHKEANDFVWELEKRDGIYLLRSLNAARDTLEKEERRLSELPYVDITTGDCNIFSLLQDHVENLENEVKRELERLVGDTKRYDEEEYRIGLIENGLIYQRGENNEP